MNENEKKLIKPKEYHADLIKTGRRADGRLLDQSRIVKVNLDAIKTADASSLVKIGHTSVVCGCKTQILQIDPKDANFQPIKIKVELPPICMNPTGFKTHHTEPIVTKTLENILHDSGCIKPEELLIDNGDRYWSVDVEVICLNYDGSLIDAALIAIISSLQTLKLNNKGSDTQIKYMSIYSVPLSMSFATIDDLCICDPTHEEEFSAQSTFSITIDIRTNRLCHIYKTGGRALTPLNLSNCIDRAKKQADRCEHLKKPEPMHEG